MGTAHSDMTAPRGSRFSSHDAPRPGDVVLVSRRLTLRAWLRAPISCLISWRIRRTTGSRFNHVACYVGDGQVVEAEWNLGVRKTHLATRYPTDRFHLAVGRAPYAVDRDVASLYWLDVARGGRARYDWRSILLMKVAAILYGPDGIRHHVAIRRDEGAFVCSELGANGWEVGGMANAVDVLKVPGDFEEFVG